MSDVKTILLYAEMPLIILLVILLVILIVQQVFAKRTKEAADATYEQPAAENKVVYETAQPVQQAVPQPVVAADPVEEATVTDVSEETAAEEAEENSFEEESELIDSAEGQPAEGTAYNVTGNSVVFERAAVAKQTWAEKYEALEEEKREMLDEVLNHVVGVDGVRRLDLTANVRVKYKTHELFKADIKRGIPVLNFMISNTSLMRYVKESGTKKIKITPVIVKLNDNSDLQLALRTADMALEQAKGEEEFKKEKRREQRREREQAKRAQ